MFTNFLIIINNKTLKKLSLFLGGVIFILCFILCIIPLPDNPLYPDELLSCKIVDRNGILLREVLSDFSNSSSWVNLKDISPHIIDATIISEDKRFYYHMGIDVLATLRALYQNIKAGHIVSGGSTITQQLAGLTYSLPQGNIYYKVLASIYAVKLECKYSKEKILEAYLNRVPYGNLTYGIEGASELYFGKPCKQLSIAEGAFLSAIPRSPIAYDPYRNFKDAKLQQTYILKAMYEAGKINEREYKQAINEPLNILNIQDRFYAPHFCDFIIQYMASIGIKGITKVNTTLDLPLQEEISHIIEQSVARLKDKGVSNGAAMVVDNQTGDILVMIGSVDFFSKEGQVNACTALRQPGSTLKPFTYGLALEKGYKTSDILSDIEMRISTSKGFYIPHNYDNTFHGPVRLREALGCSYNIPAIKIVKDFGTESLLDKLHQAGFDNLTKSSEYYGVGLTLGNGEVTLMELVNSYRSLASGGRLTSLHSMLTLTDEKGNSIDFSEDKLNKTVFTGQVSFLITDILSDNFARTPAFGWWNPLNISFPCAAKTGTSRGYRDNWTIGYTPKYTVGVWIGNFNADPMKDISGITGSGPVFREIMYLLRNTRGNMGIFKIPDGIITKTICPSSGKLPGPYCRNRIIEYYLKDNFPKTLCDVHRAVKLDKRTGLVASKGCPKEYIVERIYEIYSPEFYGWMEKEGLMPPRDIFLELQKKDDKYSSEQLLITFPLDGDIFKIDPFLRPEYQILHMKAMVPEGIKEIAWYIDDKKEAIKYTPFIYKWKLVKGHHSVFIKGGHMLSKTIRFKVE